MDKQQSKERKTTMSRKDFLGRSAAICALSVMGLNVVFGKNLKDGVSLVGLEGDSEAVPGKSNDLSILNTKPWNAETPPHLLDPDITPAEVMFVRNNGMAPTGVDPDKWTLSFDGESVVSPKSYSLNELKSRFKHYSYQLTLECGGNGRSEFNPPAKGNQWTTGAVSCAMWTGVRLKDVLNDVGIKSDAVYIGYHGADTHLSGDTEKEVISRGVPISKAMEEESLIAFQVNGEDIPAMNGYPLRLVFGGWPASTSGKWLKGISVRNKVHDGAKMDGDSYRVPKHPVAPGTKVPDEDMEIIEAMPVKSLITYPKTGAVIQGDRAFEVRGHAWAGDLGVKAVHISIDFGATWLQGELTEAANRNAWQHFKTVVTLPQSGYYEIWAKATDTQGKSQPMVVPGWNPKGYLNNACHRIAVKRV